VATLSNTTTSPLLANCNLAVGFIPFGQTSVTVPPDGTGNPAYANAMMLGSLTLAPGEAVVAEVQCFGAPITAETLSAIKVGTLTIQ
jgi:hypothetical protein